MELLSVKQVAHFLGVTPRSVYRWIHDGKLPGVKIGAGKLWRINAEDVQKLIHKK